MFYFGMLIIFSTLIYLLVTAKEKSAFVMFIIASIAYLVFSYGVPVNEINLLLKEANIFNVLVEVAIIFLVFYLIGRFEDTIFTKDYNLVLRSFFFRFETITLALYLLGILLSSGNLIIDFLTLTAVMRLLKVDKFISYVTMNAVLFTNAIFVYPISNLQLLSSDVVSTNFLHTSSMMAVVVITAFLVVLYFSGFLVRSLEKDITVEFRIILIIAVTAIVGFLGVNSFSTSQLLVYLPLVALILLYLNDMNVRKKFSRYSKHPITLSIILFASFIATIYLSSQSFLLFLVCVILINSILLNEQYQEIENLFVEKHESKNILLYICCIIVIGILANYSYYNATEIGVPYIQSAINGAVNGSNTVLSRTFELYANAAFLSPFSPMFISDTNSTQAIQYLIIAIPALSIISIPTQIIIQEAVGYKTKISSEVLIGVISLGLLTLTLVSYAIGA